MAELIVTIAEFADVTENLLKPSNQFGLTELLNNPAYKRYVRSLSVVLFINSNEQILMVALCIDH